MGTNNLNKLFYIFGKQKVALNDRHAVRGLSHLATINVNMYVNWIDNGIEYITVSALRLCMDI